MVVNHVQLKIVLKKKKRNLQMLEKLNPEWEHWSAKTVRENSNLEIIVGKKVEALKYDYGLMKLSYSSIKHF